VLPVLGLLLAVVIAAGWLLPTRAAPRRAAPAKPVPAVAQAPAVPPPLPSGWRPATSRAYVLRRQVPARTQPDAGATVAFWLKGGTRVPVLEQGRATPPLRAGSRAPWWRVGGKGGRSGWVAAADLEPEASCVLVDVASGRVLRRLAVMEQGLTERSIVSDGKFLWSFSDDNVYRISAGDRAAIFRYPFGAQAGSFAYEAVWAPDRTMAVIRLSDEESGSSALAAISLATGAVRRLSGPAGALDRLDAQQRLLISRGPEAADRAGQAILFDLSRRQVVTTMSGSLLAATKTGPVYLKQGRDLVLGDAALEPGVRVRPPGEVESACLSPDEQTLALFCSEQKGRRTEYRIRLLRADTLAEFAMLPLDRESYGLFLSGIAGGAGGWLVVREDELGLRVVSRYSRQGRRIRTWERTGPWAASPNGRALYLARESDILVVRSADGAARRIPFSWRRRLPARYLPRPTAPGITTRLEVSGLTLTPDGRTLIVTEYLNRDGKG